MTRSLDLYNKCHEAMDSDKKSECTKNQFYMRGGYYSDKFFLNLMMSLKKSARTT